MANNFDRVKKETDVIMESLRKEMDRDSWTTVPVDKRHIKQLFYRIKQLEGGFKDIYDLEATNHDSYHFLSRVIAKASYAGAIDNEGKYSFVPDRYLTSEWKDD